MRKVIGLFYFFRLAKPCICSFPIKSHSYENNAQLPSLETAIRLALLYHTSLDYLTGMDQDPVIKVSQLSEEERVFVLNFIRLFVDKNRGPEVAPTGEPPTDIL